jgi:hypothetical protein
VRVYHLRISAERIAFAHVRIFRKRAVFKSPVDLQFAYFCRTTRLTKLVNAHFDTSREIVVLLDWFLRAWVAILMQGVTVDFHDAAVVRFLISDCPAVVRFLSAVVRFFISGWSPVRHDQCIILSSSDCLFVAVCVVVGRFFFADRFHFLIVAMAPRSA